MVQKPQEKEILEPGELEQKPEAPAQLPEIKEGHEALENQRAENPGELRQKIENLSLPENINEQAQSHAHQIASLSDEEKIKQLMAIAKKKGVVYAVRVAQKTNDPYLLDLLHDRLAQDGHYKSFLK